MHTLFKNATIFDPRDGRFLENAALLVNDDVIEAMEEVQKVDCPPNAEVVDLSGKWIIPGLLDCHVHLDMHGMADTYQENLVEDKLRTLRVACEAEATLKAGFTTVRNIGTVNGIDFALKAGIEAGYCRGPRLITAGRIISMTCSGTEYFDGMYRIADGPDECRRAAREQLKQGADFLKLMATGAVMNPGGVPGASQLEVDEMQAVVEEGLKLGKHTAAHAHGAQGIKKAVAAGVRTIEHGTMADEDALVAMAEADAFLVPTMMLHTLFEDHAEKVPEFMLRKSRIMEDAYKGIVLRAKELGVEIAMGTDAGTNFNYHGNNAAEIVYLVENEIMRPSEALTCATLSAARAIQMDHQVGSLESGKLADFVVLTANPLADISVLAEKDKIEAVYKGGELIR
jgi:imidazolonepropionase-like amidohydrolase